MPLTYKTHKLLSKTRIDVRKEIIKLFLEEKSGRGTGELSSKYEYEVEKYKEFTIILKRPAPLNKGFDFIVHIKGEDLYFGSKRKHTNPSHKDIIDSLQQVKDKVKESNYEQIKTALNNIYNLKEFNKKSIEDISFTDGGGKKRPILILILAVKWLFIEQDVTYWNWSGRAMLMNVLKDNDLI